MSGMRPFEHNQWPDETVAKLTRWWLDGLSQSVIADRLGISKSAVGGKIHRLDLPRRPNPAKHKDGVPNGSKAGARDHHTAPDPEAVKPMLAKDRKPPAAPKTRPGAAMPRLYAPIRECAWPLNDRRPWKFCDAPTEPGKPYCRDHCKQAKGKPVSAVKEP